MGMGETIREAVELGKKVRHVLVATAAKGGLPHLAAAGRIDLTAEGLVTVSAWFCPGTVENLQENRLVSLVLWDPETDRGHQLLGEVVDVEETAFMNGYSSEAPLTPQVERKMVVRVNRVLAFSHAPHTDRVEERPSASV